MAAAIFARSLGFFIFFIEQFAGFGGRMDRKTT
jgi:hypothetical protein